MIEPIVKKEFHAEYNDPFSWILQLYNINSLELVFDITSNFLKKEFSSTKCFSNANLLTYIGFNQL